MHYNINLSFKGLSCWVRWWIKWSKLCLRGLNTTGHVICQPILAYSALPMLIVRLSHWMGALHLRFLSQRVLFPYRFSDVVGVLLEF